MPDMDTVLYCTVGDQPPLVASGFRSRGKINNDEMIPGVAGEGGRVGFRGADSQSDGANFVQIVEGGSGAELTKVKKRINSVLGCW